MDLSHKVSLDSLSPNPFLIFRPFDHTSDHSLSDDTSSKAQLFIYKRHDKSLYELSRKFLLKHWHHKDFIINLEKLTLELDIERRRLYDIINILESLG